RRVLEDLDVAANRALVVDIVPEGIQAGREAGSRISIAIARSAATPEQLRRGGATAVVADLQDVLGPRMSPAPATPRRVLAAAAPHSDGASPARGLGAGAALASHRRDDGFVWLSFVDPAPEELRDLQYGFGLHEVAGEDMLARHERPKFEAYPGPVYLV